MGPVFTAIDAVVNLSANGSAALKKAAIPLAKIIATALGRRATSLLFSKLLLKPAVLVLYVYQVYGGPSPPRFKRTMVHSVLLNIVTFQRIVWER